ncbi:hypothetical protein [Cellulomonas sp.]|uniref:hypothetical protein n=1 Tax=Cellulomonas sp. TaxID=40001 RepID=UPI003BAA74EF
MHPTVSRDLNALSPLGTALLDEPEIREHRDALDALAAREIEWTTAEQTRYAEHVATVRAWEADTEAAILTGTPVPPVPAEWRESTGAEVIAGERSRILAALRVDFARHRPEILARHAITARAEYDRLTAERDTLTARLRTVAEQIESTANRWRALDPETAPGRSGVTLAYGRE